jgi:hypothetical protein
MIDGGGRGQRIHNGCDRDASGTVGRETIDAGGDGRKGYRGKTVLLTEHQRTAIAGGKQIILTVAATIPHRPNRVDHMTGLEPITLGDLGITGGATLQRTAFGQQFRPRGPMDRAIDPAAAEQRRIGGVDDGVNAKRCNIGDDDFQPGVAELARREPQADAAALATTPLSANSCCNSPAWNISRMMSQPPTNSPLT